MPKVWQFENRYYWAIIVLYVQGSMQRILPKYVETQEEQINS